MSNDYVLAIDFGTQSVRAIIYNDRGMEICKAKVPFTPYFSVEQRLGGTASRNVLGEYD